MISVEEALQVLSNHPFPVRGTNRRLKEAVGSVLWSEIKADRDFPPYHRVTMDGIAIRHQNFHDGQKSFSIESIVAAGQPAYTIEDSTACVEIMTGAVLPHGLDTVIRYEDLQIVEGVATVLLDTLTKGHNVHARGSDRSQGDILVPMPRLLTPAEIAIAATVGCDELLVAQLPRVLVVSTGDELVPVSTTPLPHQIRTSNNHTIDAALRLMGLEVDHQHLADDQTEVRTKISDFLENYEIIILIGGSSKGKFDYVPKTLKELGVTEHFYRVKQRPGKPFMFGTTDRGNFVFALPGNPVSAFLCLLYYFRYWLQESYGIRAKLPVAKLTEDVVFKPDLTYFPPVGIQNDQGQIVAKPVEGRGSGDLANLADADAFLVLAEGRNLYEKGSTHPYVPYRSTYGS